MGSYGDVVPPTEEAGRAMGDKDEEITVMVTGFAPFRAQNPKNPAWEITRLLPPFLLPAKTSDDSVVSASPRVRILIYPDPIKVAYKAVRELVPKLWDYADGPDEEGVDLRHAKDWQGNDQDSKPGKKRTVDYMIHIGMASGRKWYSIERRGHREGYVMKDVDGKILEDDGGVRHKPKEEVTAKKYAQEHSGGIIVCGGKRDISDEETPEKGGEQDNATDAAEDGKTDIPLDPPPKGTPPDAIEVGTLKEPWIWEGLPKEILTDIDVDDVWKRWRLEVPDADARISEDPGRYLCDFIYYSSLAELTKREEEKRVLFLHVPVEVDDESIKTGVDVTCALIRGIVDSGRAKQKLGDDLKKSDEPRVEIKSR